MMMKISIPVMTIALCAAFLFASCNKDYTCTCAVNTSGSVHVISTDVGKVSQGDATNKCNAVGKFYTDSLNAVSASCHL